MGLQRQHVQIKSLQDNLPTPRDPGFEKRMMLRKSVLLYSWMFPHLANSTWPHCRINEGMHEFGACMNECLSVKRRRPRSSAHVQCPRWGEGIGVVYKNVICRRVIGATCKGDEGERLLGHNH